MPADRGPHPALELLLPAGAPILSADEQDDAPVVGRIERRLRAQDPDRIEDARYLLVPKLALPATPRAALLGAIALLRPAGPRGRAARRLLLATARAGALSLSAPSLRVLRRPDRARSEGLIEPLIAEGLARAGRREAHVLSATQGTRGPFEKASIRALGLDGALLAHVKAGASGPPAGRIAREVEVLERLASLPFQTARVPRILAAGAAGRWSALVLEPLPAVNGDSRVSPLLVEAFHLELHRLTAVTAPIGSGALWRSIEERAREVDPIVGRALQRCRDGLVSRLLPLGLAHRDLASWNLLPLDHAAIGVVDWELAADGAPPLFDLFHFLLFEPLLLGTAEPEAAARGLLRPPGSDRLRAILRVFDAPHTPLDLILLMYLIDRLLLLEEERSALDTRARRDQIDRLLRAARVTLEHSSP